MLLIASRIQLTDTDIWTNDIENDETILIYLLAIISITKSDKLKSLIVNLILLNCYKKYADVFLKDLINQLSENELHDHVINLKLGKTALYKPLYNLSETKLATLWDYIDTNLLNNFIKSFKSSAEALILFIKKKDSTLRLYIDYRNLNLVIIKNHYLLSLISESLNHLK